jgi:LPS-assembly protein
MKNNNIKILYILFSIFFLIDIQNSFSETSMYSLEGGKLFYKNNNKLIIAEGNASARSQNGKEIFADKIIYNKDKNIIITEPKSIFKDNKGNTLFADKFIYDIKLKKIEATTNVKFLDKNGNLFQFTKLIYFDDAERGVGENLVATLKDKSSIESERAEFDNNLKTLIFGENKKLNFFDRLSNLFKNKNNTYTSCENKEKAAKTIEERCPAWSITSQTNIHDQNEKMIYHYDTLIKIKNIPVFYTPYFAHPDPSVKRKSGFLTPGIKNISDLGQTVKIPYFFEIDNKRDFTFSPIYYFNENSVFLGEKQSIL